MPLREHFGDAPARARHDVARRVQTGSVNEQLVLPRELGRGTRPALATHAMRDILLDGAQPEQLVVPPKHDHATEN
eukprot:5042016-Pyramimonas_sp.AAC.1